MGDAFAATFDVDGVATWAVGTITEVLLNWVDANFSDGSSWVPINQRRSRKDVARGESHCVGARAPWRMRES